MPPAIDQFRQRATTTLSGFSLGQKVVTAIAGLGLVIGGLMFSSWAGKPHYAALFTNLAPQDAASITQKLTTDKISYQLADGGATVVVPQSSVYSERIKMSAAGLPTGGTVGYSLLDKQGITTSEFTQRVDYQRALEGELAKTISAIDGVSAATVHLVIPPAGVFADGTQKPSASVLVLNTPGKTLDAGQVQSVVHLVASAVQDLDPTEVTVADGKGNMLWAPGQDGATMAAGNAQQQATATYQNNIAQSVQQMLASVIGPNHAVVRVTANLSFDQSDTTTESYANGPAPALDQSSSSETFTGTGAGAAAGAATTATSTPGNYSKQASATNFAVGKVTAVVKKAPGSVQRLSVAVAVDSKVPGVNTTTLQSLVSAAAGITPSRGDTVDVSLIPFDTTAATQAQKELQSAASAKSRTAMMGLARTVAILLAVFVVILLLLRAIRRAPQRMPLPMVPEYALEAGGPVGAASTLIEQSRDLLGGEAALPPGPAISLAPESAGITTLIDSQPDQVAELLRTWLADRRS